MQESFPQTLGHSSHSNWNNSEQLQFGGQPWWCTQHVAADKHEPVEDIPCDATTGNSISQDSHEHHSSLQNTSKSSRITLPKPIHTALKVEFKKNNHLCRQQRTALAMELGIPASEVKIWFKQSRDKVEKFKIHRKNKKAKAINELELNGENILSTPSTFPGPSNSQISAQVKMRIKHLRIAHRVWSLALNK